VIILRKRLKYTRLSKRGASKVFENGEMGIILWTTNRGSVGVEWDSGEYGEYNDKVDELFVSRLICFPKVRRKQFIKGRVRQ